MKKNIIVLLKLIIGLFIFAVGIVLTINANLGLSPWDVFHQGISKITGLTIGQVSIIIGAIVVLLDWGLGEKIGWATILNIFIIGVIMDFLMLNNIIPTYDNVILRVLMILLGLFLMGIGTYYYINVGLGSGPRDGLMVALTKRTNKSVRFIRNSIELIVLIIGYFLGGSIGVGTIIMVIGVGYFVQFAFYIFKFDVSQVEHKFLDSTLLNIKKLFKNEEKDSMN